MKWIFCAVFVSKLKALSKVKLNSKINLEIQAKKMKMNSKKKFPIASLGATVHVFIPDVDKGWCDLSNILAAVMIVTEDSFYQLGTSEGLILSNKTSICEITIHFMA